MGVGVTGGRRSYVVHGGSFCGDNNGVIVTWHQSTHTKRSSNLRSFSDAAEKPKKKIPKAKKKVKSSDEDVATGGRSRDQTVILAALDAPRTQESPAPSADELARREHVRKAYTVGKFKQHNQLNHELTCKIQMKKHALKMLPKNSTLKEKALEVNWDGPPRWRRIPAWTPPIPGFNPKEFMAHEE